MTNGRDQTLIFITGAGNADSQSNRQLDLKSFSVPWWSCDRGQCAQSVCASVCPSVKWVTVVPASLGHREDWDPLVLNSI